jgi:hypothetical protein
VQWIDDSILEVTSKDEPAVVAKLFNESPKSWLKAVRIKVVCLIEDHYLLSVSE